MQYGLVARRKEEVREKEQKQKAKGKKKKKINF